MDYRLAMGIITLVGFSLGCGGCRPETSGERSGVARESVTDYSNGVSFGFEFRYVPEGLQDEFYSGDLTRASEALGELVARFQESPTQENGRAVMEGAEYLRYAPELTAELLNAWVAVLTSPDLPEEEARYGIRRLLRGLREDQCGDAVMIVYPRVLIELDRSLVLDELLSREFYWASNSISGGGVASLFHDTETEALLRDRMIDGEEEQRTTAIQLGCWMAPEEFLDTFIILAESDPDVGQAALLALFYSGHIEEGWAAIRNADEEQQERLLYRLYIRFEPSSRNEHQLMLEGCRSLTSERGLLYWAEYASWNPEDRRVLLDLLAEPDRSFSAEFIQEMGRRLGDEGDFEEAIMQWQAAIESGSRLDMEAFFPIAEYPAGDGRVEPLVLASIARLDTSYEIIRLSRAACWSGFTEVFDEYAYLLLLEPLGCQEWASEAYGILEGAIPDRMHAFYLSALHIEQPLDDYNMLSEDDFLTPDSDEFYAGIDAVNFWRIYVAWRAAGYFQRVEAPSSVEPLRALLSHDCLIVALAAVEALGNQGDPSVISDLEPLLDSDIPGFRTAVRNAIDELQAD
jgi:hypothetical protein